MPRTSIVHYIAPSAISIVPNANESANDLAVYILRNTKIRVYSPKAGVDFVDGEYQEWTLTGRNRRLADSAKPYTIYARLPKNGDGDGYLVFAPKTLSGTEWEDKYPYITPDGIADIDGMQTDDGNWYVRLGDVSLPQNGLRTVTFDTGILCTNQYNTEWEISPSVLPLRIELGCTIDDEDAGPTPYVYWGKSLFLIATLVEGWTGTDIQRFRHWEIVRNTGDVAADHAWNTGTWATAFRTSGNILLSHIRGAEDDFNATVNTMFQITAWGVDTEGDSSSSSSDSSSSEEELVPLATVGINIMAETWEKYELALSSAIVSYNPQTKTYTPEDGVTVRVRATDQRGEVTELTNAALAAAGLSAGYAPLSGDVWTPLQFSGPATSVAVARIGIDAFYAQQSLNVRLTRGSGSGAEEVAIELARTTIAFVRDGEDSKVREWIFLRSRTPITFGDASSEHPLPALIAYGEVNPNGAAGHVTDDKDQDGWVPEGWWDEQQGVDDTYLYEYSSYRDYMRDDDSSDSSSGEEGGHWGDFTTPHIWNHYGSDAVVYDIVSSVSVLNADEDGTVVSDGIVVTAFRTEGDTRSGNILPSHDYPVVGDYYYAEYRIDDESDWHLCGPFDMPADPDEDSSSVPCYGIAPEVVVTAKVGITLRLKHTSDTSVVLKENAPINVVKDGKSGYTVSANPPSVAFDCNVYGQTIDTSVKTVALRMFKGDEQVQFSAVIESASHCAAWMNGSNLLVSVGQGWLHEDATYYTDKPSPYVSVGDVVYNADKEAVSTVSAVGNGYIEIDGVEGRFTAATNLSMHSLINPGRISVVVTSEEVSRNIIISVIGLRQAPPDEYLSKTHEDVAAEVIGFAKGLWVKAKELFGIDGEGNAKLNNIRGNNVTLSGMISAVRGIMSALQSPNFQQDDMNGSGWRITDTDENGHSKMEVDNLLVRMRFIANILEARKYVSLGGNYVYSPASSIIEQVDYYDANGDLLGYDTIKVPWLVRTIPMLSRKFYSKYRTIKRVGSVDMADVVKFRCWIKADDGTTKTINTWQVGMLARCQTMDVSETEGGTHTDANTGATGNRLYWRECVAKGQGLLPITDGLIHSYVDLSNASGHFLAGSDAPLPGDSIVCYGATVADYSHIIEIETVGSDAPAIKEYRGVGLPASGSSLPTFSTEGKRKTMISPASGNEFHAPRFVIETTSGDEELYNGHYQGHAVGFYDPATPANGDIKLKTFTAWSSSEVTHYVYNNGSWSSATDALGSYYISDADNHRYLCTSMGWKDIGLGEATKAFKLEVVGDVETAFAASTGMNYTQTGLFIRSSEQSMSRIQRIFGKNMILHSDTGEGWSGVVNDHVVDCDGADATPPSMHLLHGMKYVFSAKQADNCTVRITFTDGSTTTWISFLVSAMSYDSTLGRYYYVIDFMLDHFPNGAAATITLNYFAVDGIFFERVQMEAGQEPTEYDVTTVDEDISSYVEQTADQVRIGITNGLTNTGINIQTGEVEIQANKFSVIDSQGNPMLGMNNTTDEFAIAGKIHATDGLYRRMAFAYLGGKCRNADVDPFTGGLSNNIYIKATFTNDYDWSYEFIDETTALPDHEYSDWTGGGHSPGDIVTLNTTGWADYVLIKSYSSTGYELSGDHGLIIPQASHPKMRGRQIEIYSNEPISSNRRYKLEIVGNNGASLQFAKTYTIQSNGTIQPDGTPASLWFPLATGLKMVSVYTGVNDNWFWLCLTPIYTAQA
jgi:hypothetical protein